MKVLCIDLRSFYASVECILRGLDPQETNLVVADVSRGEGSIVLAVTPKLKKLGVKSRCRIFELPKEIDIIFAKPRMKKYIEFSSKVYEIYLKYVSEEDIHIYSIDEAFLDLTSYLNYYKLPIEGIAKKIIDDIYHTTKIEATCGIGDNMFLAKVALDCLAKNMPNRIAYLNQELFIKKMWDYHPLNKIWGIGTGIEKRLNKMNIYTLRELANTPQEILEEEFGILGKELYEHAYGIDYSTVKEVRNYQPTNKSLGYGQVLFRDYNYKEMEVILLEMIDDLATELVMKKLQCQLIHLSISYTSKVGGGFSRQMSLPSPTNSRTVLFEAFKKLYYQYVQDIPIRKIQIRVGKLSNENYMQTSLFTDSEKIEKERRLLEAIGQIKARYGKNAVNLAVSHTEVGTQLERNKLIGGHNAE